MRCKHCGSKMIFPDTRHKEFSTGKAIAGVVTVGLVGAAAGFIGKDIKGYRCSTCGMFSEELMNCGEESLIDSAVREAQRKGKSLSYERYREKYRGIEQVALVAAPINNYIPLPAANAQNKESDEDFVEDVTNTLNTSEDENIKHAYSYGKYVKGCPVFIETVTIEEGERADTLRMSIRNISNQTLRSVYFKVVAYDDVGDQVSECSCVYQGLSAAPGEYLPFDKTFDLKTEVAYKVTVDCEKAAFTDDSVWRKSEAPIVYDLPEYVELTPRNFPQYKYLTALLAENSNLQAGSKLYMPVFEADYRVCVCGSPAEEGTLCPTCHLSEESLQEYIDYNTLLEYRETLIKQTAQKRADVTSKLLTINQDNRYRRACSLMEKGTQADLEAAKEIFLSIGKYKDAQKLVKQCEQAAEDVKKKRIYDNAKALMLKRVPSIKDFEAAIMEFKKIPGWNDADEQIEICKKKIEELKAKAERERKEQERQAEIARQEEARRKKRNTVIGIATGIIGVAIIVAIILLNTFVWTPNKYNDAIDLYNAKKYVEAVAAFQDLGSYEDAETWVKKSKYEYIMSHKNNTDTTTYQYLCDLKQSSYKDSIQIYNTLYAWKIKLIANLSKTDKTNNIETAKRTDTVYIHILVEGGIPGETERIKSTTLWGQSVGWAQEETEYLTVRNGDAIYVTLKPNSYSERFDIKIICDGQIYTKRVSFTR